MVRIDVRLRGLSAGNPGDVRPIAEGASERRIDYGPGHRFYFVRRGTAIILLLCGGAQGMTEIAEAIGLSRTSLYKALTPAGNPEFATVVRVLRSPGLRVGVRSAA